MLGGEEGDTAMIGGSELSRENEKQTEWKVAHEQLAGNLQTSEVIVPRSLRNIALVKLRQQATPTDTQRAMLEWTQEFKNQKIEVNAEDEQSPRLFYAAPSKPFAMRQGSGNRGNEILHRKNQESPRTGLKPKRETKDGHCEVAHRGTSSPKKSRMRSRC